MISSQQPQRSPSPKGCARTRGNGRGIIGLTTVSIVTACFVLAAAQGEYWTAYWEFVCAVLLIFCEIGLRQQRVALDFAEECLDGWGEAERELAEAKLRLGGRN